MSKYLGLKNTDPISGCYNLCYINTFIQCLCASDHFIDFIERNKEKGNEVIDIFHDIIDKKLKSGDKLRMYIYKTHDKTYLPNKFGEYCSLLLYLFDDCTKYNSQFNREFDELFCYTELLTQECKACNYKTNRINDRYSVDMVGRDAFKKYNDKTYNNDTLKWEPGNRYDNTGNLLYDISSTSKTDIHRGPKCEYITSICIIKIPKILVICLSTIGLGSDRISIVKKYRNLKINKQIKIKKKTAGYYTYELVSIAVHLGIHYICKMKLGDKYIYVDDMANNFREISEHDFFDFRQNSSNYHEYIYYSLIE